MKLRSQPVEALKSAAFTCFAIASAFSCISGPLTGIYLALSFKNHRHTIYLALSFKNHRHTKSFMSVLAVETHCRYGSSYRFVLLFGENPQVVTYSAQPLCWSCWENSSPTTDRGAVRKDEAWATVILKCICTESERQVSVSTHATKQHIEPKQFILTVR